MVNHEDDRRTDSTSISTNSLLLVLFLLVVGAREGRGVAWVYAKKAKGLGDCVHEVQKRSHKTSEKKVGSAPNSKLCV